MCLLNDGLRVISDPHGRRKRRRLIRVVELDRDAVEGAGVGHARDERLTPAGQSHSALLQS
jgi:hypothetical protein